MTRNWRCRALLALAVVLTAPSFARAASKDDPWQGFNRPVFTFNDALDRHVLEPVARGWHAVVPDRMERWFENFFRNLATPVVLSGSLLQAKPRESAQSIARFAINTTVGIAGFGDPASDLFHVPIPNEDVGQALGYWGVPPGPYLQLPFLGPSNVRDAFGRTGDALVVAWPWFVPWWASTTSGAVDAVSTRAHWLDPVQHLRETSVDYYAAQRDAYLQRRASLVADRVGEAAKTAEPVHLPSEEDLYFPDDDAAPASTPPAAKETTR